MRISSLRDGLDFNRGMAHIASPVAGGKIELTLQCSRGTRMHLQRMQLLEGTPGKYLLKQAERQ